MGGINKKAIGNIRKPQERRENVNELSDNYSKMISDAKFKAIQGEGLKILTLKQILQRLLIALAKVKADNTSETY